MKTRSLPSIFIKRLLIGLILSGIILSIHIIGIEFDDIYEVLTEDIRLCYFTVSTGFIIALFSSWYYLVPFTRRKTQIISTMVFSYLYGILSFHFDISNREGLDGLATAFIIAPQLILVAVCTTFFGIKDILKPLR